MTSLHKLSRTTDPSTSRAAASFQIETLKNKQLKVIERLRAGPMHDDQLATECFRLHGWPVGKSTARTRRAELVALGLVRNSGRKALLPTGCKSIIWEIVNEL